jgi:hypothetical protein
MAMGDKGDKGAVEPKSSSASQPTPLVREYRAPMLQVLGSVRELTLGGSGSNMEHVPGFPHHV